MTTDETGRHIIGITSKIEHSVLKSLKTGVASTWALTKEMINYLDSFLEARVRGGFGPVGIVNIINDQAKLGIIYIANLAALIV